MTLGKLIDTPPVWLALFAALAWLQGRGLGLVETGGGQRAAGWALLVAGAALLVAAALEFRRNRTTIMPHETPRALIAGGVYRVSRNPIYLGDALILAGLCLLFGAPDALWLVPGFMMLITRRFIRPEEARLRAAFGDAAERYMARVRRWL